MVTSDREEFRKVAANEIDQLVKMGCFEIVDANGVQQVMTRTWNFRHKKNPAGEVFRLETRFFSFRPGTYRVSC